MAWWAASLVLLLVAVVLAAAWIFYAIVVGGTCGEAGEPTPCWGAVYFVLPAFALSSLIAAVLLAWRAGKRRATTRRGRSAQPPG